MSETMDCERREAQQIDEEARALFAAAITDYEWDDLSLKIQEAWRTTIRIRRRIGSLGKEYLG